MDRTSQKGGDVQHSSRAETFIHQFTRGLERDPRRNVLSSRHRVLILTNFDAADVLNITFRISRPHRAPELLFSPPSYSAIAIDLWSLGTTIAQFFTPLQLIPSRTPPSSPSSPTVDEVEITNSSPFVIPNILRQDIDYHASWERKSLFDAERGELGLAWSIFRLRGTPNEQTWPVSLLSWGGHSYN